MSPTIMILRGGVVTNSEIQQHQRAHQQNQRISSISALAESAESAEIAESAKSANSQKVIGATYISDVIFSVIFVTTSKLYLNFQLN